MPAAIRIGVAGYEEVQAIYTEPDVTEAYTIDSPTPPDENGRAETRAHVGRGRRNPLGQRLDRLRLPGWPKLGIPLSGFIAP